MTDAVSTLQLGVQTKEALDNLMALQKALRDVKGEMATLSTPLTGGDLKGGFKGIQDELRKLNTQFDDFFKNSRSGFQKMESEATGSAQKIKATYRNTLGNGISLSMKLDTKSAIEAAEDINALLRKSTVLSKAEDDKRLRHDAVMQEGRVNAEKEAAARKTMILLESAAKEREIEQRRAQEHNNMLYARAQADALFENRVRDRQASEIERQRRLNASFMSASPTSRLHTANEAAAYGTLGGDVKGRYGSQVADLVNSSTALANLNRELGNNNVKTREATSLTKGHADVMRDAHSAARGLAGGFQMMWLTWGNIVPLMAGFAIASILKNAATAFIDVQYQMTFTKELAEGTTQSVAQLAERLHDQAKFLGITTKEAGAGLRALAQAGLSTEEAFTALSPAFKLATIGETDMASASIALVGILNSFGMEVGQAQKMTDLLAKTGSMSASSISNLTEALKYAAPTANQFKVSAEETLTVLNALARVNITGSSAGTALKNMIKEMAAPSTEAVRELLGSTLQFSAYDAAGKLKPLLDQVDELKEKLKAFDRESQNNILIKLFGERGDKAFFSLISRGSEQLRKDLKEISDSAGFTDQVFASLQNTVRGQLKMMVADIDNTLSDIGKSAQRELSAVAQIMRDTFADESFKSGLVGLAQSVAQLGKAAVEYGPALVGLFFVLKSASMIAAGLMALRTAILALGVAMAEAGSAAGLLMTTLSTFAPWARLLGLVTALAGGYMILRERKDSVSEVTIRELKDLDEVVKRMKKENDELEKRNNLIAAGIALGELETQIKIHDSTAKITILEAENHRMRAAIAKERQEMGGRDSATTNAYGQQVKVNEEKIAQARTTHRALMEQIERNKEEQARAKALAEGLAIGQKARGESNMPAGEATWKDDPRNAGKTLSEKKQGILEEFHALEALARDRYASEIRIADAALSTKATTEEGYRKKTLDAEKKYQDARLAAETVFKQRINSLQLPNKDRETLVQDLTNEVAKIDAQRQRQEAQNQIHTDERVEIQRMRDAAKKRGDSQEKFLGEQKQAIMEAYREELTEAQNYYEADKQLANDYHKAGVENQAQYLKRLKAAQDTLDQKGGQARASADNKFDALNLPEKTRKAWELDIETTKRKMTADAELKAQKDALNATRQMEIDLIHATKDANDYLQKSLPKMEAEQFRAQQKQIRDVSIATLPVEEQNLARAKETTLEMYAKEIDQIEIQLRLTDERIEQIRAETEAAARLGDVQGVINGKRAEEIQMGIRGQQVRKIDAVSDQGRSAVQSAVGNAKQLNDLNKWNVALQRSQDIASKLGSTFGKIGTAIGGLTVAFIKYGKTQEDIEKRLEFRRSEANGDPIKLAKANTEAQRESAQAQIENYGDMVGAAKGFFDENSKGYKALQAAEQVFRAFELAMAFQTMLTKVGLIGAETTAVQTANEIKKLDAEESAGEIIALGMMEAEQAAITGIATQAEGEPYSAWARMAAMAATMAALGIAVGGIGSGGGSAKSAEEIRTDRRKTIGTGSVLGDENAKSESIGHSLELMAKNSDIGLRHTNAMRMALESIRDNISAIGVAVSRSGGILGSQNYDFNGGRFHGKESSFLGFSSNSRELLDAGLQFDWANLGQVMDGALVSMQKYQLIRETESDWWGLFGDDVDEFVKTSEASIDVRKAVSSTVRSLADALLQTGVALGETRDTVLEKLRGESFQLGTTSFAGLSAKDAEEQMNALFSDLGDRMAKDIFPQFERFQRSGEGYMETTMRVAAALEQSEAALAKLGVAAVDLSQISNAIAPDLAAQRVRDSLLKKETTQVHIRLNDSSFVLYTQLSDLGEVMKNLQGTADELAESYLKLKDIQQRLAKSNTGRLSDDLILGAGGVDNLQSGLKTISEKFLGVDEFTNKLKAAQVQQDILTEKFADLGLAIPKTREQYVLMINSLLWGGEASDRLRGRLISLADEMDQVLENDPGRMVMEKFLDDQTKLVDALKDSVQSLLNVIKSSRNAIRDIDKFLLPEGQKLDNSSRIEELRAMLGRDNLTLEQQMELAGELKDLVLEKYDTEKQNATDLLDFAKRLKGYLEDLKTGDLSPLTATQRLQEAKAQYESTLAKAQSGDADARDQLTQKADTYLKQAREYFASSGNYTNIFDTVYGALEQLQLATDAGAQDAQTAATQQNTEEIRAVRDILESINAQAQGKYDQQIIELKNALVWQQKIEAQLGIANTQLSQLASMPADIASALADTFPGLKNFDPSQLTSGGNSHYFPLINSSYSPFSSAMMSGQVISGESYDQRYARIYQAMYGLDPYQTGGKDFGRNYLPNWASVVGYGMGTYLPPSHATGLDYVPFDNYTARLHQGERVLTAAQTRDADATASEVRSLRQAVERMCEEHRDNTMALIRAQYDSTDRAAEKIVDGQHEAVDNVSWKNDSEPTLR